MSETAVEQYLSWVRLYQAAATYIRKKKMVLHFLNYCKVQEIEFTAVQQQDITSYLSQQSCKTVTKKVICSVLRELYEHSGCIDNPTQSIVFRKEPQKIIHLPSKQHLQDAIAQVHDQRNRLLIEFAYGSGLRRAELWALSIEDIDIDAKTIYVHGKGGVTRIVPITKQAIILLKEYLKERSKTKGPLFVSLQGKRIGVVRIEQIFKQQTGLNPHVFRHACASHMLENGCSLRVLQEFLGHKNLSTTCIYTHIDKQALKEVLIKFHPRSSK